MNLKTTLSTRPRLPVSTVPQFQTVTRNTLVVASLLSHGVLYNSIAYMPHTAQSTRLFDGHIAASTTVTFRSAGSRWCFWQCETARGLCCRSKFSCIHKWILLSIFCIRPVDINWCLTCAKMLWFSRSFWKIQAKLYFGLIFLLRLYMLMMKQRIVCSSVNVSTKHRLDRTTIIVKVARFKTFSRRFIAV